MANRRWRNAFVNLLLAAGSITLSILAAEFAVRVLDIPPRPLPPLAIPSYQLSADPAIIFEYRPNYRQSDMPYHEQLAGFSMNRDGFRDRDYEESKSKNGYRIIVLGDSTTAGSGVPNLDATYPKVLERLLNYESRGTGRTYEVLNMGVGGYQTMQEIATLRAKGLKYDPDLVLITFCLNDFDTSTNGGVYEALRAINTSHTWEHRSGMYGALLRNCRLAFMIHHRARALFPHYHDHDQWYADHILRGRSPVHAGFELLAEMQRTNRFAVLVVILPAFDSAFSRYQYDVVHQAVFRAAANYPMIKVIDLLDRFASIDDEASKFSIDVMHLNEYGHRAMASILMPIVLEQSKRAVPVMPSR